MANGKVIHASVFGPDRTTVPAEPVVPCATPILSHPGAITEKVKKREVKRAAKAIAKKQKKKKAFERKLRGGRILKDKS